MSSYVQTTAPGTRHTSVMERSLSRSLARASQEVRFLAKDTEYHIICTDKEQRSSHEKFYRNAQDEKGVPLTLLDSESFSDRAHTRLRLMLQRERPLHVSGKSDLLPFRDAAILQETFQALSLPASYLQIADGSLATAQAHISRRLTGKSSSSSLEMIVYCVTKQGDWSMALSHQASTLDTSIFCSLDKKIDAQPLVDDLIYLKAQAFHPMLIPCIMFDTVIRMGIDRRRSIKDRLQKLESIMARVGRKASQERDLEVYQEPEKQEESSDQQDSSDWTQLFELLYSCRKDQTSRKGRYDFWKSYHAAIQTGFKYTADEVMIHEPNEERHRIHLELEQWVALTWQKLNSLIARDKDHINRVENVSTLLHNLVQQRDIRLQSSIARATQRDSQDMKFIAVLGSVFLPASLVATVLNVPEFQFLPGPQLFGAYIGISVPFIAFVVVLCMTRSRWSRWNWSVWRRLKAQTREDPSV